MFKQYLILFLLVLGCKEKSRFNKSIQRGDLIITGHFLNDTILDDTISYSILDGKLIRKEFYVNGKQNGWQIMFYSNRSIKAYELFENGLKNGDSYYFDTLGRLVYSDFSYYNLTVGPVIFYDTSGNPNKYFFSNLQNEDLLVIDYKNWKGVSSIVSSCINFTSNKIKLEDGSSGIQIILYMINPPRLSFEYSVVKSKLNNADKGFTTLQTVKKDFPFKVLELPLLDSLEEYSIMLTVYDSLINKKTVIYKSL